MDEFIITVVKSKQDQRIPSALSYSLQESFRDEKTVEAVIRVLKSLYPDYTFRVTKQMGLY